MAAAIDLSNTNQGKTSRFEKIAVVVLIFLILTFCFVSSFTLPSLFTDVYGSGALPAPLHASEPANYLTDPYGWQVEPLDLAILTSIIKDDTQNSAKVAARLAAVQETLKQTIAVAVPNQSRVSVARPLSAFSTNGSGVVFPTTVAGGGGISGPPASLGPSQTPLSQTVSASSGSAVPVVGSTTPTPAVLVSSSPASGLIPGPSTTPGSGAVSASASATSTGQAGYSATATATNTNTPSRTVTPSRTNTSTFTATTSGVSNPSLTPTPTQTNTPTPIVSTSTSTRTPTPTSTSSRTPTPTSTSSRTPTPTSTSSSTPTPTSTSSRTNTPTSTATQPYPYPPYVTHTFTSTPTATHTLTLTPTHTNTFTFTPTATHTLTYTPSPTNTRTPTRTFTSTSTRTPTITPTLPTCGSIAPGGTVLTASSDTYIDSIPGFKNVNFGSADPLIIRTDDDNFDTRVLIRFNFAGIPSNARVLQATFYLYQVTPRSGAVIALHRITDPWSESAVTWENRPDFAPIPVSVMELAPSGNCLRSLYMPDWLIQGWINGSIPNYGMSLNGYFIYGESKFASRENPNPYIRPQLRIVYTTNP